MLTAPAKLSAALADRYRLTRELGAGGMATVYLADDLRHSRQVAVKVLRPELAESLGIDRFLREITTTANLRHAHILPLYDSGEADGHLFYVMPFVEGESLRDRLTRDAQLPMDDALRFADEVADALHYAHSRGVVHRDIKPENILIENGHAVVADFGIASAVSTAGSEKLTMTGMALGTPHYMSPEQASGDVVDARTDLYALGCVLYEMLAGSPPFNGPTAMAVMARHAIDPVPSLRTVRPGVSAAISAVVERALAKTPVDRFATVQEWRRALDAGRTDPQLQAAPAAPAAFLKPPPTPATPLLGRESTLNDAEQRIAQGARLLTVTGVGGTGKTRFAMQMFQRLAAQYPDGAAFVSLASVTAPAEVLATIGTTLEIAEAHGRSPLDAAVTVIGSRRTLLVIDNFEQVLGAAEDIAQLLARCPNLLVVTTSRAPLKIGAEVEFVLPPLALPGANDNLEALLACPSIALFVQRAEKVKPGFALTAANSQAVASICRQLDGLPLALELAAARVRIMDPATLLQRLDHALDLLTSGDRDLPLRQRTLRATISWSYSLLDANEQRLLRRLSTFLEGWTLEAMEQVCFGEDDRWQGIEQLESLVEKGLVRVLDDGARYTLLETIRAFAAEQLHAGGEVEEARTRHIAYFVEFLRQVRHGIVTRDQLGAMAQWRADAANTQAAVVWAIARARLGDAEAIEQGLMLCGCLNWPWHIAGLHLTGQAFVEAALSLAADRPPTVGRALSGFTRGMIGTVTADWAAAGTAIGRGVDDAAAIKDAGVHAELLMAQAYVALSIGDIPGATTALQSSLARARESDVPMIHAFSLAFLGFLQFLTGDVDGGTRLIADARRTQTEIGDYEGGGITLSFQAQIALAAGNHERGIAYYREAEDSFLLVGDKPEVARVQGEMAWASLAIGATHDARAEFLKSLRSYDEVGSQRGLGQAVLGLAVTEQVAGNQERAVRIAAAASVLSSKAGVVVEHPMLPGIGEKIAELRASIPAAEVEACVAAGRVASPAEVLAMLEH
jgi:serine/threonine-protein kinase PknK